MKKFLHLTTILLFCSNIGAHTIYNIGDTVSNFDLETSDGKTIQIDDLKGKVVYLSFFATWCRPCINELEMVKKEKLYKIGSNEDFYFITLGRGHSIQEVISFKCNKGYDFTMGVDTKKDIFSLFSEKGIPLNIVIDRNGKIIYKHTGFSKQSFNKMKRTIKKAL